jgi:SAM-dependent methyltransferase
VPEEWTRRDVEALHNRLPLPQFREVLDIGCGIGRVAGPLAQLGYNVTGIDSSSEAITSALLSYPEVKFIELDLTNLDASPLADFDSCLVLWHSFGYFSAEGNTRVLRAIRRRLRIGGLAIFDLFNPEFAKLHVGKQKSRGLNVVEAETVVDGDRLLSIIKYAGGQEDRIEFQIYEPTAFMNLCHASGFRVTEMLTGWETVAQIADTHVRFQMVCEAIEGDRAQAN